MGFGVFVWHSSQTQIKLFFKLNFFHPGFFFFYCILCFFFKILVLPKVFFSPNVLLLTSSSLDTALIIYLIFPVLFFLGFIHFNERSLAPSRPAGQSVSVAGH